MGQKGSFYSDSKFWAIDVFPKGIGRSGHFNKEQASLLENHGKRYLALTSGDVEPCNDEEKAFVSVFKGEKEAITIHEKVWERFLDVTGEKRRVHYSVSASATPIVDFSSHEDADEL